MSVDLHDDPQGIGNSRKATMALQTFSATPRLEQHAEFNRKKSCLWKAKRLSLQTVQTRSLPKE